MKNFIDIILLILVTVVVAAVLSVIFAYPTMLLWNWLAPTLSKGFLPTLNFWQTWGLMILINLLAPTHSSTSNKENRSGEQMKKVSLIILQIAIAVIIAIALITAPNKSVILKIIDLIGMFCAGFNVAILITKTED